MPDDVTIDRRSGYKTLLYCDPEGGTDFEQILGVMQNINGRGGTRDEADVSFIDDDFEHVLPGIIRTGTLTFDHLYDPNHETSQLLTDLFTQVTPIPTWKIVYQLAGEDTEESPTSEPFSAWVKGLGEEIAMASAVKRTVTLRITGDPGFTPTEGS